MHRSTVEKLETTELSADAMGVGLVRAEEAGEMSPIEVAMVRRLTGILRAAEKMATAIEAYEAASECAKDEEMTCEEGAAIVAAIESAILFRQAMRGEL